jgi:lycopene cyclase domain-containing protein
MIFNIDPKYTYLLLNAITLVYPIAQSFERRLRYFKKWKYLFPAILITGIFFITWDVYKTAYGVWSFNPEYLTGIYMLNLPVEEWLFFLTVPYAIVFIYEVMNYFVKKDIFGAFADKISLILGFILVVIATMNYDKAYTLVNFGLLGFFLLIHYFFIRAQYMGRFYLAYLVSLIPFAIINGFLTALPVVMYDDTQNLGIRLYTIPIEDTMYSLFLFLMTITFYEFFKKKY